MQRVVIYVRYSTDMQNPTSCADQERNVRMALPRYGVDPTDALVIHDAAESGTKTFRGEFERLTAMMKAKQIAVLAVDDQARLTRADNASAFITDLVFAGGRFISTGEGIDTTQQGWRMRVKVMEVHNSITIEQTGENVRRGQRGRLFNDQTAGDYAFGYTSQYVDPQLASVYRGVGPKPPKRVVIKEEEATWVRQIFAWFIGGWSVAAIARELTTRGVPTGSRSRSEKWSDRRIRRMLENPKYIGDWTWGAKTTIRDSTGRVKQVPATEEVVRRENPHLRIIDSQTWEAAQERLKRLADVYGLKDGQLPRGPHVHHTDVSPASLLGGLIYCGLCGSRLWQVRSGRRVYLACHNRGDSDTASAGLCPMTTTLPVEKAERVILDFTRDLLCGWPEWLQKAAAAMRRAIADGGGSLPAEIETLQQRLRKGGAQIENLLTVLADGNLESKAIRRRLVALENQVEQDEQRLRHARDAMSAPRQMPSDQDIAAALHDASAVFQEDFRPGALLLRKLFGKITAHQVIMPGKQRGFIQLTVRVHGWQTVAAALEGKMPASVLEAIASQGHPEAGLYSEFRLNVGGPTQRDLRGREIAEMRHRGVPWKTIYERTGMGSGPAYAAYKRYLETQDQQALQDAAATEGTQDFHAA